MKLKIIKVLIGTALIGGTALAFVSDDEPTPTPDPVSQEQTQPTEPAPVDQEPSTPPAESTEPADQSAPQPTSTMNNGQLHDAHAAIQPQPTSQLATQAETPTTPTATESVPTPEAPTSCKVYNHNGQQVCQ